ncbi:nitrite/sulfite reductase [Imtechella halotolerans]|uniref:Ferredoxin-nitrite reductase n=1 Tax=Imtechella halotolerans K1 TaxID=946077 RepID=I0WKH7_9FLAO|nr:nitrite/sulfite reductase [Imtechella halotolerans]EID76893.1 ferredoxin-nitrite reductase [Imtechella halotolerans K1]WMQ64754.1 nitrite/sulfite reductase [Imtechella halotolerans]
MQSFRTELENPLVQKEIIDLEKKIHLFQEGKVDEERFRSLRLARGIYGQRQPGVQMIRIKLPYGKVTGEQLIRIADVADEYSNGVLHITTRQDIQIHYVNLDKTPELWAKLAKDDITLREACGNTVRNVTASETAGIDPLEPFDVTPYAHAVFQFFLRNPICQEMGRKIKISFSATDKDTALSYLHDLGFIPKLKDGKRGFKVMLGGGLGSQPRHADVLYNFLPEEKIIAVTESVLRVFDRYGERSRRMKARMKFLIADVGLKEFVRLINEEQKALSHQEYCINIPQEIMLEKKKITDYNEAVCTDKSYNLWKLTSVFEQKQMGFVAVGIKVTLGNFRTEKARSLASIIQRYGSNEMRFTLRQNILLRNIQIEHLPELYNELKQLQFTEIGYNSLADITACPGTDTCNLGIASSTGIASALEKVLYEEYPQYLTRQSLTIKISGCMNACGQHNMAHIGFQGMSVRTPNKLVAPALQVLLGGSVIGDGQGRFADKVIKIPSKRGPEALRIILNDYDNNGGGQEYDVYYQDRGEHYFYDLLKHLSPTDNLSNDDFIDWGHNKEYVQAVGVGECAGVVIDLVQTLLYESKEKLDNAVGALSASAWSDGIYYSYSAFVNTAKAILLANNLKTNTQAGIIKQFDEAFISTGKIEWDGSFEETVYQINKNNPTEKFAQQYLAESQAFLKVIESYRENQLSNAK